MSRYDGMSAEDLATDLARNGYTQEGVDRLYQLRGLGTAPRLPAGFEGVRSLPSRGARLYQDSNGRPVRGTGEFASFLNTFNSQAVDPWNEWGVGNYLGLAGLLVGGGAALGPSGAGLWGTGGSAAGTAAGTGTLAGSGAAATTGGLTTSSGLGIFGGGGAAGLGTLGAGNAGALAASGAITGGAGITSASGALGSLGRAATAATGAGTGASMGWTDWIGPALSAGASIYGSGQANNATDAAQRQSTEEQRRQFDLVRSDTAGQRALGDAAIGTLARYYGYNTGADGGRGAPDTSVFTTSPEYQFNLSEGQKAIDRSAAARGGLLSGGAVKEGARFASGNASRESSAFLDRLMQQAGIGSTGIGASAAAGSNAANNISATAVNAGNARASTYMNNAANVNNSIQTGIGDYMLRRYLGQG